MAPVFRLRPRILAVESDSEGFPEFEAVGEGSPEREHDLGLEVVAYPY
jgi:hypothetical protein